MQCNVKGSESIAPCHHSETVWKVWKGLEGMEGMEGMEGWMERV